MRRGNTSTNDLRYLIPKVNLNLIPGLKFGSVLKAVPLAPSLCPFRLLHVLRALVNIDMAPLVTIGF